MRTVRMLLVAVVAGSWGGCASLGAHSSDDAIKVISALEDQWIQMAIQHDSAGYERLLAPAFVYTENDEVVPRAQLIKDMTRGTNTITSGKNEDLVVRVSGNTAIATGWLTLVGHGAQGDFNERYRFTDTWQFLDGRWQVLGAHDYIKR
jgi:ketosteroid isomerase-like protein